MRLYTNLYGYEAYDALESFYMICKSMDGYVHADPLDFVSAPPYVEKTGELYFLCNGKHDIDYIRGVVHFVVRVETFKFSESNPLVLQLKELGKAFEDPHHKWHTPLDPIKQSILEKLLDDAERQMKRDAWFDVKKKVIEYLK